MPLPSISHSMVTFYFLRCRGKYRPRSHYFLTQTTGWVHELDLSISREHRSIPAVTGSFESRNRIGLLCPDLFTYYSQQSSPGIWWDVIVTLLRLYILRIPTSWESHRTAPIPFNIMYFLAGRFVVHGMHSVCFFGLTSMTASSMQANASWEMSLDKTAHAYASCSEPKGFDPGQVSTLRGAISVQVL